MHRACVLNWEIMKTTQFVRDEIAKIKEKMVEEEATVTTLPPGNYIISWGTGTACVRRQMIKIADPMDKVREPLPVPDRRSFRQKHGGSRWPQK